LKGPETGRIFEGPNQNGLSKKEKKRKESFSVMFCHHLNFQRPIDFNFWEEKFKIKQPPVSVIVATREFTPKRRE
jgi:hypothetical protein